MTHFLKSWPHSFQAIMEGTKLHEVRNSSDRHFMVNDYVILQEWDPEKFHAAIGSTDEKEKAAYTGRKTMRKITHVTVPGSWGLPEAICVFSIK
jgi:hypothetical protein